MEVGVGIGLFLGSLGYYWVIAGFFGAFGSLLGYLG
jgi:hypothetical protein